MKVFGYRIISEEEYQDLKKSHIKYMKVVIYHRWFAGWKDLDIIWNYILQDTNFGGIGRAREDYAKARNTGVYGELNG